MPSVPTSNPAWMVINQTQSPFHQELFDRLTEDFGPCLLYTGTAFPGQSDRMTIRKAVAYDRKSLLRRALSWFRFSFGAAWLLLRMPRHVPVLVVTNPPLLPLIACVVGWLRRRPYAVLAWDLYPEHLVAIGWFGDRNLIVRLWRRVNRSVYRRARVVITIGHRMAAAIQKTAGDQEPIAVIPNWADTELLRPIDKADNAFAQQWNQVGKVTVMYSGNIGATHGATLIADVAKLLEGDSRLSFLVIGDGLGRAALKDRIEELGLTNIQLLDYQPWTVVPLSLGCADLAFVMQDAVSARYSVPSKVYSFLAAGSAILAVTPADSDLHDLVAQHRVGLTVTEPEAVVIAAVIRGVLDQAGELDRLGRNARSVSESHFSSKVATEKFRRGLESMVGGVRQ